MRKSSSVPKELATSDSFLPVIKDRVSIKQQLETPTPKLTRERSNARGSDYLAMARRSVFDDFEEYLQRNDEIDEREMKERGTTIKFFCKKTQFDGMTGLASNKITDPEQERMRIQKIKEDTKPLAKNISVEQIEQARKNLNRNLNMQRTAGGGKILINELWSQNYQRRIMKWSHLQDLIDRVERKRIKEKFRARSQVSCPDKSIEDIIQQIRSTPNSTTFSLGWRNSKELSGGDSVIEERIGNAKDGSISYTSMVTSVRIDESTMGQSFRIPEHDTRVERWKSLDRSDRKIDRSDSSAINSKRSKDSDYFKMIQGFDLSAQKLIDDCQMNHNDCSMLKSEIENLKQKIRPKESKTDLKKTLLDQTREKRTFEHIKYFFDDKNKSSHRQLTSEEKFMAMWQDNLAQRKSTFKPLEARKSILANLQDKSKETGGQGKDGAIADKQGAPNEGACEEDQPKLPTPRYKKRVFKLRTLLPQEEAT